MFNVACVLHAVFLSTDSDADSVLQFSAVCSVVQCKKCSTVYADSVVQFSVEVLLACSM